MRLFSRPRRGDSFAEFRAMSQRERREYLIEGNRRNVQMGMLNILIDVVAILLWTIFGNPFWAIWFCLLLMFAVWNYNNILRQGKYIRLPEKARLAIAVRWWREGYTSWPPKRGKMRGD